MRPILLANGKHSSTDPCLNDVQVQEAPGFEYKPVALPSDFRVFAKRYTHPTEQKPNFSLAIPFSNQIRKPGEGAASMPIIAKYSPNHSSLIPSPVSRIMSILGKA